MRLLVLGGTGFVGRSVIESALRRGDEVTTLNRGCRPPIPGVRALTGDRTVDGGLTALDSAGSWDAVVDTWSASPNVVQAAARYLAARLSPEGGYVYISSGSVYRYPLAPGADESSPVVESAPAAGENGEPVEYAEAKRGGELAVQEVFGDRALLARAGLILGPHEDVGRLPWWLLRIAQGGLVPAPGPYDLGLQYVDARDLADWALAAVSRGLGGAFNVTGPAGMTSFGALLEACVEATGAGAELLWLDPSSVLASGARPWIDLPIWLPPGSERDGLFGVDVSKALAAGLRCRPTVETVADTWAWLESVDRRPWLRPDRPRLGLDPALEEKLLRR